MNACGRCGGSAFRDIRAKESVFLGTKLFTEEVAALECVSCREGYVPAASTQRFRLRVVLFLVGNRELTSEALTFGRKALGLSPVEFAHLCQVSSELVLAWEASQRLMPPELYVVLNALVRDKLEGRITTLQVLQRAAHERRKPKPPKL